MQENDFISAQINTDGWIGLREVPGDRMNWTDESNGLVYVNWSAGEPVYKDDQNDCAYFSVSSGTWNTTNCDQRLHFVCEKGKNWSSKAISMLVFSSGGVGVGIGVRKIKTFPFLPIPFATPPFVRVERRSRRPNQLQRPEWSTVIGLFFASLQYFPTNSMAVQMVNISRS